MTCLALAFLATACEPPPSTDLCKGRLEGDLVISEVMLDPAGADTGGEWIEIFNNLGTPLELKGMTLFTSDATGGGMKTHAIRAGTVPARGYFVLGDVRSGPNPAWVNYAYGTSLGALPNSSGRVGVRCGQTVLGSFTWSTTAKAGRSRSLDGAQPPSPAAAADEANYCDTPATTSYSMGNAGTPGAANATCERMAVAGSCIDAETGVARPIVPPTEGQVVITEVMARPKAAAASTGEWVELLAQASVDLNGLRLATATTSTVIDRPECLRVVAGAHALLARSDDPLLNGHLPPPQHVYGSLTIADTTQQTLTLSSPDGVIDQAVVFPSTSGRSWQLDPTKLDATSNDSPESFCVSATAWAGSAGDFGSPGEVNPACPVVPDPDVCFDETTSQTRAIRRPAPGELAFTEWMSQPSGQQSDREYLEAIAKNDFDLNGLTLQIGASGRTPINSVSCLPVTANSYLLFGRNDDAAANGGLPPLVASFTSFLTGTSTFSLLNVDGGVLDTLTASGEYAGASVQIAPGFEDPVANDVPANRCRSPNRWAMGSDFGSPGAPNVACPVDAGPADPSLCFDNGLQASRPIRVPADGELVITEWMPNPNAVGDADGEYFEVLAKADLDLNGVSLRVGSSTNQLTSSQCLSVTANSSLVFGKNPNAALNGNLPALAGQFSGSMTNGAGTIAVLGPDGGVYDSVAYAGEGTAAWPAGASQQLRPEFSTAADNDVAANLCVAPTTERYGTGQTGDRGTPGRASVCP